MGAFKMSSAFVVLVIRFFPLFSEHQGISAFNHFSDQQWVEFFGLCWIVALTSGKPRFRRGMKLGMMALVVYRAAFYHEATFALTLQTSILGRFCAVLETLPALVTSLPYGVDYLLAQIPLARLVHIAMDVAGVMLFTRIVRALAFADRVVPAIASIVAEPQEFAKYIKNKGYELVKDLPMVKRELAKEAAKMEADLERDLKSRSRAIVNVSTAAKASNRRGRSASPARKGKSAAAADADASDKSQMNRELPRGRTVGPDAILSVMKRETKKEDVIWQDGKVSGGVYHGGKDHQELLNDAFAHYSLANPLHADIWPSLMKFESEVIAMTASLMYGGQSTEGTEICGSTSSGGTESILLAIKAARDYYRDKKGIGKRRRNPEVIACVSAHAAVDKACDMMGLKLVQIPFDESPNCKNPYQMDVGKCRAAVNENTIMIYSSAPSFPQGVIDPVTELAEIAVKYDVALHVDCCLGGFILPFARDEYQLALAALAKKRDAGASVEACAKEEERVRLLEVPPFDFTVPGVSSMSVDTHKFGYALKGTSVVLYKTKAMRQSQYFCYPQWSGGMYTTPTIAGSRSGGLIAQCWASMMSIGYDGYRDNAVDIMTATKSIAKRIENIPGLKLLGNYAAMVVCFASDDETVNTYSLADQMSKRGWSLNILQNPSCAHLCVTRCHIGREDLFVGDLVASLEDARAAVRRGDKLNGNAAIYGMASSMPSGPVEELLKCYNDVVLKL